MLDNQEHTHKPVVSKSRKSVESEKFKVVKFN